MATYTRYALTTADNPYDPFTQFHDWYMYDCELGHNTSAYIARLTDLSDELTDQEVEAINEAVIDGIIESDPFHKYIKVSQDVDEFEYLDDIEADLASADLSLKTRGEG